MCNHENKCHCDPGWAPPYCDVLLSELPKGIVLFYEAQSFNLSQCGWPSTLIFYKRLFVSPSSSSCFFLFFFLHKLLFLGTPKQLHSVCWTQPDSSSRKVARTEDSNDILFPKQLVIAVTCSSLDARWRLMSVCVNRNRFSGAHGVTGCRFTSLSGPEYWEFDVLYQKNPTCEEVQEVALADSTRRLSLFTSPAVVYVLSCF